MLEIMTELKTKIGPFLFVNHVPPTFRPSIGSECTHNISLLAAAFEFQGSLPVIYLLPFELIAPVTVSCLRAELPLCVCQSQFLFIRFSSLSLLADSQVHIANVLHYKFQCTSPIPVCAPSVSNMTFLSFPSISNRYTLPPKSVIQICPATSSIFNPI